MDLYVIRHAEAVALGEVGVSEDAERPLTSRGIEQAQVLADALRRKGVALNVVVTSPLLRARQTAEEMLRSWPEPAPELQVCDHLAPGGKRRKLARFLRGLAAERVALVGHEPDLGQLAGWLIGSRKVQIDFAKGGVARLLCEDELSKDSCTLLWLAPPELLAP